MLTMSSLTLCAALSAFEFNSFPPQYKAPIPVCQTSGDKGVAPVHLRLAQFDAELGHIAAGEKQDGNEHALTVVVNEWQLGFLHRGDHLVGLTGWK